MQGADTGHTPILDGADFCVGIVQARFNAEITTRMAESCIAELHALGVAKRTPLEQPLRFIRSAGRSKAD